MGKKSRNVESVQKGMAQGIVYIYVLFLLGIYPLLFRNGYTDILDFKSSCFLFVNIITYGMLGILGLTWILLNFKTLRSYKINFKAFSWTDWFVLGFGLALTLSWLFSDEIAESFWGTSGRQFGYLALILCVLSYFVISRYLKFSQGILWTLLTCGMLVFAVAILNFFQIDILGMYSSGWQNGGFLSTLGNVNSLACYSSIILPIGMVLFCVCKTKLSSWIYGVFCVLGFIAMVASSSDSIFASVAMSFLVLFWFIGESATDVKKYLLLIVLFVLSIQLTTMLHHIIINQDDIVTGLAKMISFERKMLLIIPFIVLLYAGYLFCEKKGTEKQVLHKVKIVFFAVVGFVAVIGIIGITIINIKYERAEALEKFGDIAVYIYFNELWGNCRGTNWIYSIQMFREFDIKHRLFGEGPASFVFALRNCFDGDVYSFDKRIIDAHNEFFQFLITTGIFGVISYFGIYITCIVRSIKVYKSNQFQAAVIVCLVSYLVQGMINNPHIYTTPIIFLIIAIGEVNLREKKSGIN